jgi:hypothetical protein
MMMMMRQGNCKLKSRTFSRSIAQKWQLAHLNSISKPNNAMQFGSQERSLTADRI